MHTVTTEQRKKLLKAIELAEGVDECKYLQNNRPACVIGQLAYLEGVTLEELFHWDNPRGLVIKAIVKRDDIPGGKKLASYDTSLLSKLQFIWDLCRCAEEADEARAEMRNIVEKAQVVDPESGRPQ